MRIILCLLCLSLASPVFCQTQPTSTPAVNRDSSATTPALQSRTVSEIFNPGKAEASTRSCKRSFSGHWRGVGYGFVNFTENPKGTWEGMELDWNNSFVLQFNFLKYDISFVRRHNFGMVTGLGFEYQRFRFNNDYFSLKKANGNLIPVDLHTLNAKDITRSTLKSFYLTIPVMLELQLPAAKLNQIFFSAGVMGGLRIHSRTKVVYHDQEDTKHKEKDKGSFNMIPFKADAVAKIGFNNVHIWGSYGLTDMFKDNEPGICTYTIGLGVTI